MGMRKTVRYRAESEFYYGVKGTSLADADEKSDAMGKAVLEMVDSMK